MPFFLFGGGSPVLQFAPPVKLWLLQWGLLTGPPQTPLPAEIFCLNFSGLFEGCLDLLKIRNGLISELFGPWNCQE